MKKFTWKDETVLKFARMSTQGSYVFEGAKNLEAKLEVFKRMENLQEEENEEKRESGDKFWKQVFLASISSGSSVDISAKKADMAVRHMELRKSGKMKTPKVTLGTSLADVLPVGVVNCLGSEEIRNVEDLEGVVPKKLLHIRNFGQGAMKNVVELVESYTGSRVSIHSPIKLNSKKK